MKDGLRYKYKIKRKYFQNSAREVADGAIKDIVDLAFADREHFFIYYSYGTEADTHAIIAQLLSAGKKVYLPRVEGDMIVPVPYTLKTELVKNSFGICEPEGQAYDGQIDVCISPLLAVNSNGYRLGYGGGYYDRYFAAHPDVLKAGLGYSLQQCEDIFEEEHDVPLDIFICERGIITFGK
ncbi:MAG: 5-formyltetrahydrofolate cyclo-ligase [Candidatus Coproplasma sp.]